MRVRADSDDVRFPLGHVLRDEPPRGRAVVVGGIIAMALGVVLAPLPFPMWARIALAVVLLGAGLALYRLTRGTERRPRGWLSIDSGGVTRTDASGETALIRFGAPFGVTVLSNHARTRALLAFTTRAHTRYLRVHVGSQEQVSLARELLARASTVADGDLALGLAGDDETALRVADALRLLEAIEPHSRGALNRIFLSDSRGLQVVLEGDELTLGDRVVDLRLPLEWRGFMFHESIGHLTTLYQATWLRQASVEAVLVAQMPTEISAWMVGRSTMPLSELTRDSLVQRALVRDVRLMQSLPDKPPPREQRLGIERLFMLPLRQALDRAPRLRPSVPIPSSPSSPSGLTDTAGPSETRR